jgi:hypothetical protein
LTEILSVKPIWNNHSASFGKKLIVFAGKKLIAAVRFVEVDDSRLAAAAA